MKKVCFLPIADISNEYVYLMCKAIDRVGYELTDETDFFSMLDADVIHFNWYEGLPIRRDLAKATRQYWVKMFKLWLLKLFGKKLVVTVHNNTIYDGEDEEKCHKLMKWLLDNSDSIVIHCKESLKVIEKFGADVKKAHYVPHPNLVGLYEDCEEFDDYIKQPNDFIVLYLGTVRPEKHVETVIKVAERLVAKEDIKILICGRTKTAKYTNEIDELINTDNIKTAFRFIEDEEIPSILRMSDALLLPYRTNSTLNSAPAFLAFAHGRTIISSDSGTAKDYAEDGLIYMYEYSEDEAIHEERMEASINQAYDDFVNDPEGYKAKGAQLLARVKKENSLREVGRRLKEIYE